MSIEALILYEDDGWKDLYPLTLTRATFQLRVGALTVLEKWRRVLEPEIVSVWTPRAEIQAVAFEAYPWLTQDVKDGTQVLVINGRALPSADLISKLEALEVGEGLIEGGTLVAARLESSQWQQWAQGTAWQDLLKKTTPVENTLFTYLWDLVYLNGKEIEQDLARLSYLQPYVPPDSAAIQVLGDRVYIEGEVVIDPFVTLDARHGPIILRSGAKIMSHVYIQGPAVIGRNSLIKVGAKIYEGTTIGPVCKVGGEVEESIFIGYSNKQHDGFIGHAYIGEWVNLGAGTNNSDLKNNYGEVKVQLPHGRIATGRTFVGLMVGDHVKAGINSMFNTGTVVGVGTNIFGHGFPPKWVPSFLWGGYEGFVEHDLEKFLATAKRVMARRKIEMTPAYEAMLRALYEQTKAERETFLKSYRN